MSDTIDALKQPESNLPDFDSFTDEQVEAVIIYLAKIVRVTREEHGLSSEQKQVHTKKFFAIVDSWPAEFFQRIQVRIMESAKDNGKTRKPNFWAVPADAMIAATKAVELA